MVSGTMHVMAARLQLARGSRELLHDSFEVRGERCGGEEAGKRWPIGPIGLTIGDLAPSVFEIHVVHLRERRANRRIGRIMRHRVRSRGFRHVVPVAGNPKP